MIDAAAAILILAGFAGLLGQGLAIAAEVIPASAVTEPDALIQYALIVGTIVVGLLIRSGRAWVLCASVVTVLLVLDAIAVPSGNIFTVLFLVVDVIVLATLFRHRWWFEWRPPAAALDPAPIEDAS